MKTIKWIAIIFATFEALLFVTSCNRCDPPPRVFREHFYEYFVNAKGISCESQWGDTVVIKVNGERITDKSWRYKMITNQYSIPAFNREWEGCLPTALSNSISALTVKVLEEGKENTPRDISDLTMVSFRSFREFVQNNYSWSDKTGYEATEYYVLKTYEFKASEINSDNSYLIDAGSSSFIGLTFDFRDFKAAPGEYPVEIAMCFGDLELKDTITVQR